jgi:hypothetical protein
VGGEHVVEADRERRIGETVTTSGMRERSLVASTGSSAASSATT